MRARACAVRGGGGGWVFWGGGGASPCLNGAPLHLPAHHAHTTHLPTPSLVVYTDQRPELHLLGTHPPTHPPSAQRMLSDLETEAVVEQAPAFQGRSMNMVLAPKKVVV